MCVWGPTCRYKVPGVLGRHHTLQLALPLFLSRVAARSVDRVAQRAVQKPRPVEEAAVAPLNFNTR